MCSISKRVEGILCAVGFARAESAGRGAFTGPGFCTRREGEILLIGYVGADDVVPAEEVQRRLSAYAAVLLAEGFRVDRVSGAYHCLRVTTAEAGGLLPHSDAA